MEGASPVVGRQSLPARVSFGNQAQGPPFLFQPEPGMWTGAQDSSGDLEFTPRVGFQDRRFSHDFPLTGYHKGRRPHATGRCEPGTSLQTQPLLHLCVRDALSVFAFGGQGAGYGLFIDFFFGSLRQAASELPIGV